MPRERGAFRTEEAKKKKRVGGEDTRQLSHLKVLEEKKKIAPKSWKKS